MRELNIITSAGAWGYGPCSTLRLLVKELNQFANVDFVGESIALEFALKHREQFRNIYTNFDQLLDHYDCAISIMEPNLLIWAEKKSIKLLSIDNLYWMWAWDDYLFNSIFKIINYKIHHSVAEVRECLEKKGNYAEYSTMYTLSDKVFCQQFHMEMPGNLKRFKDKIHFVEPMVDLSFKQNVERSKYKILISFSGMINPYVKEFDLFIYVLTVEKILRRSLKKYGGNLEFIFTVPNPMVNVVRKVFPKNKVYSFNHREFMDTLNESLLVMAPAGMATMFECLAYDVPLFILPEQHDGNYTNYIAWYRYGKKKSEEEFRRDFPEVMLSTRFPEAKEFPISKYYEYYLNELMSNKSILLEEFSSLLEDVITKVETKESSIFFASNQKNIVSDILGGFNGVKQTATLIKDQLGLKEG